MFSRRRKSLLIVLSIPLLFLREAGLLRKRLPGFNVSEKRSKMSSMLGSSRMGSQSIGTPSFLIFSRSFLSSPITFSLLLTFSVKLYKQSFILCLSIFSLGKFSAQFSHCMGILGQFCSKCSWISFLVYFFSDSSRGQQIFWPHSFLR